ncbi:CAP domain-containing protein [Corynebacterium cystitidis]|uniref:Uncharacterized conserved protein YkwD, contains CAP (CSP/antigen 5/PR1) domain n=1 Tax=Corynebacterium cystitidis DSM 20524 TaxID=1121357 RepID=A0A1H9UPX5_9CORY|nr:CAP domain-containing protein [Corynebacterium cystitidis]WJY81061.1 Cysteine-rich secretory protein family protein [Corynebacterium cystitidis DSM 20524]SES11147.1 Uncharacterized conserved protein YkwD, contains CAP (CSP/antigen 5/PR1) domain [Corynebacterium cystitidis DSM 20524]SNV90316.1 putative secreted protein [Corynebacterium cystitidis]
MRTNRVKRLSATIVFTIGLSTAGVSPAVADSEHPEAQQASLSSLSSSSTPTSSSVFDWSWDFLKFWEWWSKSDDSNKGHASEGRVRPAVRDASGGEVVVGNVALTSDEARMLELLNNHREAHGVQPLKVDQQLMDQSREWSGVQARENRMYHGDYNVFENVAMNWSGDPDQFFNMWKNSPGHNRNMLNSSVTKAGFGSADSSNGSSYGTMQLMW